MHRAHVRIPDVFVPDGAPLRRAFQRTTHLGIGAHPDDLEILAIHGILACFGRKDRSFLGIVLTDGAGAPRSGKFKRLSGPKYVELRKKEQQRAAVLGRYSAVVQLGYASPQIKSPSRSRCLEDLMWILAQTKPDVIYTHSLADSHDTHMATTLTVVRALRKLKPRGWPKKFYGCEVWRSLDWLPENRKVALNVSARPDLATKLLRVFKSQISGGKQYDLAVSGRRKANATFAESHAVDRAAQITFAMDLMPLLRNSSLSPSQFTSQLVGELQKQVQTRIVKIR